MLNPNNRSNSRTNSFGSRTSSFSSQGSNLNDYKDQIRAFEEMEKAYDDSFFKSFLSILKEYFSNEENDESFQDRKKLPTETVLELFLNQFFSNSEDEKLSEKNNVQDLKLHVNNILNQCIDVVFLDPSSKPKGVSDEERFAVVNAQINRLEQLYKADSYLYEYYEEIWSEQQGNENFQGVKLRKLRDADLKSAQDLSKANGEWVSNIKNVFYFFNNINQIIEIVLDKKTGSEQLTRLVEEKFGTKASLEVFLGTKQAIETARKDFEESVKNSNQYIQKYGFDPIKKFDEYKKKYSLDLPEPPQQIMTSEDEALEEPEESQDSESSSKKEVFLSYGQLLSSLNKKKDEYIKFKDKNLKYEQILNKIENYESLDEEEKKSSNFFNDLTEEEQNFYLFFVINKNSNLVLNKEKSFFSDHEYYKTFKVNISREFNIKEKPSEEVYKNRAETEHKKRCDSYNQECEVRENDRRYNQTLHQANKNNRIEAPNKEEIEKNFDHKYQLALETFYSVDNEISKSFVFIISLLLNLYYISPDKTIFLDLLFTLLDDKIGSLDQQNTELNSCLGKANELDQSWLLDYIPKCVLKKNEKKAIRFVMSTLGWAQDQRARLNEANNVEKEDKASSKKNDLLSFSWNLLSFKPKKLDEQVKPRSDSGSTVIESFDNSVMERSNSTATVDQYSRDRSNSKASAPIPFGTNEEENDNKKEAPSSGPSILDRLSLAMITLFSFLSNLPSHCKTLASKVPNLPSYGVTLISKAAEKISTGLTSPFGLFSTKPADKGLADKKDPKKQKSLSGPT